MAGMWDVTIAWITSIWKKGAKVEIFWWILEQEGSGNPEKMNKYAKKREWNFSVGVGVANFRRYLNSWLKWFLKTKAYYNKYRLLYLIHISHCESVFQANIVSSPLRIL